MVRVPLRSKRYTFLGAVTAVVCAVLLGVGAYLCARPTTVDGYYRRGMSRLDSRDYRGAVSDFSAALSLAPSWDADNRAAALVARGIAELQAGAPGATVDDVSKAIDLKPGRPDDYTLRAYALLELGRRDEAAADWKQRLRLLPDDRLALTEIATALAEVGRFREAMTYARRLAQIAPSDGESYYAEGYVSFRARDYDAAIKEFSAAIKAQKDYAAAYFSRGYCYYRLGMLQAAETDRRNAGALNRAYLTKSFEGDKQ